MKKDEDLEIFVDSDLCFRDSTEDLSHLISEEFSTTKEKEEYEYVYTSFRRKSTNGIQCYTEAAPISLNVLREKLIRAEKAGATHVSVDFHCDHNEYDIYGFKLKRTSEEDLETDKKKALENKRKTYETKIKEYENKISNLKKELE